MTIPTPEEQQAFNDCDSAVRWRKEQLAIQADWSGLSTVDKKLILNLLLSDDEYFTLVAEWKGSQ